MKHTRTKGCAAALVALFGAPACWQAFMEPAVGLPDTRLSAEALFRGLMPLCLTLGLVALSSRLRWAFAVMAFVAFFSPFELLYLSQYGLPSGLHVYGVIADTDVAEALSWIGPWLVPAVAAATLYIVLLIVAAQACWRADWQWRHRSRLWVVAAVFLLTCLLVGKELLLAHIEPPSDEPSTNPYLQQSLALPGSSLLDQLEAIFPWGLPQRLWHFIEHERALSAHREAVQHYDFLVQWRSVLPMAQRQIHVLVIGETGRPDRWALFGGARATTPRLASRTDLALFTNAISGASATRESIPLMLTRRPAADLLAPTGEPSVVTAFRQAGFKTYWLSTQGSAGAHETPISVMAREADEQHFINGADYRGAGALDGDLLPLFKQILERPEARQLIVLHTLGSHLNYAHRYPREFERFKPALQVADKPNIWQDSQAELMRNAYDNSVLYTDHVVDSAIALIERTKALATLTYAADHGETLYDGSCGRAGHGFAAEVNYRVPMFVWASAAWRKERGDDWQALQANRDRPISTMSISATLMGMAGFMVAMPSAYPDLSSTFTEMPPRLVTHFGDFDKNLMHRSCDSQRSR